MNLRLQMNPHFLFNSLNSIQHLIVSQQTNEAYKYLSVFSAFLRSVLQYTDKTVIKLDEELKMLDMYIRLELLGSDKAFDYSIVIDEQLEPEDILIPPLIIQPLVENAIWHGLMHKEGDRLLTITFKNGVDEHMICTVDDNGIGRTAASAIGKNNLNNFAYQSKSTALIKERLRLLEIKTGMPANIQVDDKLVAGKSTGTSVRVTIPFYNIDET
jgi:LytS/YehU family sensor histidine kinase